MTDEELINVCQAVSHGNSRKVKNLVKDMEGVVISFEGKNLSVRVGNRTEKWDHSECEKI